MNRSERRNKEKLLKKSLNIHNQIPVNYLHLTHSQEEVNHTKSEIKEFIKTYSFLGSTYEKDIEKMKSQKHLYSSWDENQEFIIKLLSNHPVLDSKSGETIYTDIFLSKHGKDYFLKYDKLDFQHNLFIFIKQIGLRKLFSSETCYAHYDGFFIAPANEIARKAFDSLTLKFDEKWVA